MGSWQRFLEKLIASMRQILGRKEKYADHLKMCPGCGRFVEASAKQCEYCDAAIAHVAVRADRGEDADVLPMTESVVAVFMLCVFFFALGAIVSSQSSENPRLGDVFAAYFSPNGEVLHNMGSSDPFSVFARGEGWRLLSYMFLHGNLIHILFNLSALAMLGPMVLQLFGLRRFWLIAFVTGVAGAAASTGLGALFWPHATVGFSGALFGFLGALWGFARREGDFTSAERWKRYMIYGNVIMIAVTFLGLAVDNLCHLGGMFAGMAMGYGLYDMQSSKMAKRVETVIVLGMFAILAFALYRIIPLTVLAP